MQTERALLVSFLFAWSNLPKDMENFLQTGLFRAKPEDLPNLFLTGMDAPD
jgi:hypothetical protein